MVSGEDKSPKNCYLILHVDGEQEVKGDTHRKASKVELSDFQFKSLSEIENKGVENSVHL